MGALLNERIVIQGCGNFGAATPHVHDNHFVGQWGLRVQTEWRLTISRVHSIMIEKSALAGEGGGCTPITITYKVAVYAPVEWAETLTLFHLYQCMYSVSRVLLSTPSAKDAEMAMAWVAIAILFSSAPIICFHFCQVIDYS